MVERKIIDVRTKFEFMLGHIEGSINIPLDQVMDRLDEIKQYENPIFCCASGHRSGQAADYLNQQGFECENGGGWKALKNELNR